MWPANSCSRAGAFRRIHVVGGGLDGAGYQIIQRGGKPFFLPECAGEA
jgi:hypothetical protein